MDDCVVDPLLGRKAEETWGWWLGGWARQFQARGEERVRLRGDRGGGLARKVGVLVNRGALAWEMSDVWNWFCNVKCVDPILRTIHNK